MNDKNKEVVKELLMAVQFNDLKKEYEDRFTVIIEKHYNPTPPVSQSTVDKVVEELESLNVVIGKIAKNGDADIYWKLIGDTYQTIKIILTNLRKE